MRYLSAFLLMACASCEAVVDLDPPEYNSELVATSHFSPDSTWSVALHRSLGIGIRQDASKQYVDGATVMIMSSAGIVDSLSYRGNGHYRSATGTYPLPETRYTLRVNVPGESGLEASSAAPSATPIIDYSIELRGQVVETVFGREGTYKLWIRFADPPGTNFYRLGVYRYRPNQHRLIDETAPDSIYRLQDIESTDPGWYCGYAEAFQATLEFSSSDGVCHEVIVTDRFFDGKEYTWTATLSLQSGGDGHGRDELLLLLSSLSEDYFEYQRTLKEQLLSGPFVEPLPVYSNVEGGLGIFAGYTNTSLILPFPE